MEPPQSEGETPSTICCKSEGEGSISPEENEQLLRDRARQALFEVRAEFDLAITDGGVRVSGEASAEQRLPPEFPYIGVISLRRLIVLALFVLLISDIPLAQQLLAFGVG